MATNELTIKNLSCKYNQNTIFKNLNINFSNSSLNVVIGENGSGKSTLFKFMCSLLPNNAKFSGNIFFNEKDILNLPSNELSKYLTLMLQDSEQQFSMENLQNELIFTLENLELSPEEINKRISWALNITNSKELLNKPIHQLSNGEKQKAALTVALAMQSKALLLDEPFANVDTKSQIELINNLNIISKKLNKIVIIIDHDLTKYTNIDNIYSIDKKNKTIKILSIKEKRDLLKQETHIKKTLSIPNADDQNNIISFNNFSIEQPKKLITKQNLSLFANKITVITGNNGTGKSTFLKSIIKMHSYQGEITYKNKNLKNINLNNWLLTTNLVFTIPEQQFLQNSLAEELQQNIKLSKNNYSTKLIGKILKELDLIQEINKPIYTLSIGQQKKAQIASMLFLPHKIILLDEPFANLDPQSVKKTIKLINYFKEVYKKTFIIVSHQTNYIKNYVDLHINLKEQKLSYVGEI